MKISIQGIGVIGGFGCGKEDLKKALSRKKSRTRNIVNDSTMVSSNTSPVLQADTSSLERFVPKRRLRRIDHFSQMAILGAYLALEDADSLETDLQNIGVVVATGYGASSTTFGFLDSMIDDGDSCASPTLFSSSVHNAAAANVSIALKATGPSLTVSQFEMSVPSALLSACQWLEEGRVDGVLFGAVDEYCEVLGYCRHRFMGGGHDLSKTPTELSKQSPETGEGAAFFLLSRSDDEDSSKYGSIVDVQLGRLGSNKLPLLKDAVILVDIDTNRKCEKTFYSRFIKTKVAAAVYNSLYGVLPVGLAFKMAIASLSIRNDTLFASDEGYGANIDNLSLIRKDKDLGAQPISCVKFGRDDEFGIVTMAKEK